MCGISGILNFNAPSKKVNALIEMTQTLVNRGPDNEGYVLFENNLGKPYFGDDTLVKNTKHIKSATDKAFDVAFGFRQLKIIDLTNRSHQPMSDLTENYWIVFNGEIYNFKEIKTELIALGHRFFSDSDTEVLLKSYIEWNEKALQKFNGMFAFAIYDKTKNEIFIARDRIGIKPLYYYKSNEHFLFASTQKAIINSKLFEPKIDWNGLHQNFRFTIAQRPNTCFENIVALEPGYQLKINLNDHTIQKKQYWEIPVNTQDFSMTEKKAANLLEESLYNAVKYRIQADVEVGSFMSGGIDSTTISVMASKLAPDIKTMTLSFSEYERFNETAEAADTAKLHNLNHIINTVNPTEVIANLNITPSIYEEPYFYLPVNLVIAKIAKENKLKVVLNGLGGDELFGGYDAYLKLKYWESLKNNKDLLKLVPNFDRRIVKGKQLANYKTIGEFYTHYFSNYSDLEIGELFQNKIGSTQNTLSDLYNPTNLNFTDSFEAISFYNLKSYIGNHQMRSVDQCTMYHSIEGRFPMLDHQFIETAFKIPTKYKIKDNVQKYILKEVAKKHIAPSCLNMKKKGLGLPLEHWFLNDLKDFTEHTISKLIERGIFNEKAIHKIIATKDEKKIWQLVSTELWLSYFFKNLV